MIPISLAVNGITVLKNVKVDFNDIAGDIIAITGKNGQGKTSLMESIFVALYRFLPSRPEGIYTYCHGKDTVVEYAFGWHGKRFKSVVNIDAVSTKMEAFLYDGDNHALKGMTGKIKDFDRVAAEMFGPPGLVLASSFAAQDERGNFLDLAKIERKQLFIEMLNLELLSRISKLAGKMAADTDVILAGKRQWYDSLQKVALLDIPEINAIISRKEMRAEELFGVRERIANVTEEIAVLKMQSSEVNVVLAQVAALSEKKNAYANKLTEVRGRLQKGQEFIEASDKIKSAAESIVTLRAGLDAQRREISRLSGERRELALEKDNYDKATAKLREDWLREQSAMKLVEKSKEVAETAAATISEVPCKAEGDFAKCQFLLRAVEGRDKIDDFEVAILNHKSMMLKIQDEQKALSKPNVSAVTNLDRQIAEKEAAVSKAESLIKSLEPIAAQVGQLEQAQARVDELTMQIPELEHSLAGAEESLRRVESQYNTIKDASAKVADAQRRLDVLKGEEASITDFITSLDRKIAQAEITCKQVTEAKEQSEKAAQEIARMERDRRQWALLEKAFGPNGIQSLEIDVAGPKVSSFANKLLFSCFGPRFSIRLITQKLLADGSGYKDEFDAIAIDSERGREGSVSSLSGGEKVIVTEAISLAVAIFNKIKSGLSWESLFRDEVTGALDDDNAPRYLSMLRKARELGHFKKVYFIAHQPRLQDLADARINLQNGEVEII